MQGTRKKPAHRCQWRVSYNSLGVWSRKCNRKATKVLPGTTAFWVCEKHYQIDLQRRAQG